MKTTLALKNMPYSTQRFKYKHVTQVYPFIYDTYDTFLETACQS